MEAEGILTVLAEVAIAIAGFSGIVVTLQSRSGVWSETDRLRFSVLLQISLATVFMSLIPILLHLVNRSETFVWRGSSGIWLAYIVLMALYRLPQLRRVGSAESEPPSRLLMAVVICFSLAALAVQIVNVGWLAAPWPHILTILLALFLACLLFVRLLRGILQPAA